METSTLLTIIGAILIPCAGGLWRVYAQLNARVAKLGDDLNARISKQRDDMAAQYLSRELFTAHWDNLEKAVTEIRQDLKHLVAQGRQSGAGD